MLWFETDISNIEIIAQCVLFFLVGYDTTATTITNTLYLLATHPEEQEIQSRGSIGKATNFIELLLEAEQEAQKNDSGDKKTQKCKYNYCYD